MVEKTIPELVKYDTRPQLTLTDHEINLIIELRQIRFGKITLVLHDGPIRIESGIKRREL